jgi:hypothetical protein
VVRSNADARPIGGEMLEKREDGKKTLVAQRKTSSRPRRRGKKMVQGIIIVI